MQFDPTFAYGEPLLGALYREMGRFDEAISLYKRSEDLSGRLPIGLAITYARMNRRKEALETLEAATSNRPYTAGDVPALVLVALGANDDAIRELQRACDEHSSSLHLLGDRARIRSSAFGQTFPVYSEKNRAGTRKSLCDNRDLIIER